MVDRILETAKRNKVFLPADIPYGQTSLLSSSPSKQRGVALWEAIVKAQLKYPEGLETTLATIVSAMTTKDKPSNYLYQEIYRRFPDVARVIQELREVEEERKTAAYHIPESVLPMMDIRPYTTYARDGRVLKVAPIHTTKLPKGTILFRGIHSLNSMSTDFLGVSKNGVYCLPPQHMVYFYPFPFIDSTVSQYAIYVIYVLTDDTEIITLISPAPLTRSNRREKFLPYTSCNAIRIGCGLSGEALDPCLKSDFMSEYPNIAGIISVVGTERVRDFTSPKSTLSQYLGTYYGIYRDKDDDMPDIPEIALHPRKVKSMVDITGIPQFATAADFLRWFPEHEADYVYKPYHLFGARNVASIKTFLDERFADRRIQLDVTTGFFVDTELAKPEYRTNLVPAGPGAIAALDPARLRFTKATHGAAGGP